jgi:hypothetical protein
MMTTRLRASLLALLIAFGCSEGTGLDDPAFRLTGLVITTDGVPGALAVAVGSPILPEGRSVAEGSLSMASGDTAALIGFWKEPPACADGCIPERFPTLRLSGDGWTFTTEGVAQQNLGTFSGAAASGYFLFGGSSDSMPTVALCGTWTGTLLGPVMSGNFAARWYMLLGATAASIVFHALGEDRPASVWDAAVSGSSITLSMDGIEIQGSVASDRRSAEGSLSVDLPEATVESTWRATDVACTAPGVGLMRGGTPLVPIVSGR